MVFRWMGWVNWQILIYDYIDYLWFLHHITVKKRAQTNHCSFLLGPWIPHFWLALSWRHKAGTQGPQFWVDSPCRINEPTSGPTRWSALNEQSRKLKVYEERHQQIWEGPIACHTFVQKWCMANVGGIVWRNMTYVHRYDINFKVCVAIVEGTMVNLMFAQFLKTNVRPLHVSYCQSFCGGSNS